MKNLEIIKKGWAMKCSCHTYITLFYNGNFIQCFDNDQYSENPRKDQYYTEHIIEAIERKTKLKIEEIQIIGSIEDFDGMRFLSGGFKKGKEWLNKNPQKNKNKPIKRR